MFYTSMLRRTHSIAVFNASINTPDTAAPSTIATATTPIATASAIINVLLFAHQFLLHISFKDVEGQQLRERC